MPCRSRGVRRCIRRERIQADCNIQISECRQKQCGLVLPATVESPAPAESEEQVRRLPGWLSKVAGRTWSLWSPPARLHSDLHDQHGPSVFAPAISGGSF